LPSHEHKAFIPYTGIFAGIPDSDRHAIINARVTSLNDKSVVLDRAWEGSEIVPFDYLIIATGTRLPAPGSMDSDEKTSSVEYFQKYQAGVKQAQSIVIVGGGAIGVQMATDIKEIYPNKQVTLVHSREHVMPVYDPRLHGIIKERFDELGIK
jgi:pyruvate/2-oxoglutarate dehydrogenase complex dihydrolipoamide dehydrogenase (E3) component